MIENNINSNGGGIYLNYVFNLTIYKLYGNNNTSE